MVLVVPGWSPPRHNEPAWFLREYTDNGKRMQSLSVVREDQLVEFPRIMGLASDYPKARDIFIFGGFEETCHALMDYADGLREDPGLEQHIAETEGSSTLMEDYLRAAEQAAEFKRTHARTVRALTETIRPTPGME
jgi:hypothetical protein